MTPEERKVLLALVDVVEFLGSRLLKTEKEAEVMKESIYWMKQDIEALKAEVQKLL